MSLFRELRYKILLSKEFMLLCGFHFLSVVFWWERILFLNFKQGVVSRFTLRDANADDLIICLLLLGSSDVIQIRIDPDFAIEFEPQCHYDYLEFRDGPSEIWPPFRFSYLTRLCGSVAPNITIKSTGSSMFIFFYSDETEQDRGFKIYYRSVTSNSRAKRDVNTYLNPSHLRGHKSFQKFRQLSRATRHTSKSRNTDFTDMVFESHRQKRTAGNFSQTYLSSYTWVNYDSQSSNSYGSSNNRFNPYDENGDITYDYGFWDYYDYWYDNYDPYNNFEDDLETYDWIQAYSQSQALDYSDFRNFALFSMKELKYFGTQAEDFVAQCTFDGRDCSYTSFQRGVFHLDVY